MRALVASLAVVLLLASVAACDTEAGAATRFDLTLFDPAGATVATLEMTLDPPAEGATTMGTYRVRSGSLGGSAEPQGTVRATGLASAVLVMLEPAVDDGGVMLEGAFRDAPFEGTWSVGTIAGPQAAGTFRGEPR